MWNSVIMGKQLPDSDFLDANIDATRIFPHFNLLPALNFWFQLKLPHF